MEVYDAGDGGARSDRIRNLGFDPSQLTPDEQRELLDLDARLPLRASEPPRVPHESMTQPGGRTGS
jgi:hypothetical protein